MTYEEAIKMFECGKEATKCAVKKDLYETAILSIEKQIPKKPIYVEEKYPKHQWQLDENGEIDFMAVENDYHNGPLCERCYESFCINCESDIEKRLNELCNCSHYVCPRCKEQVSEYAEYKHCENCGQALDWSD